MKVIAVGLAVALLTFVVVKNAVRQGVGDAEIQRMTMGVVNSSSPATAWNALPSKDEFYRRVDAVSRDYALGGAAGTFILTVAAEALWRRRKKVRTMDRSSG